MTGLPRLRAARLAAGFTLRTAGELIGKTDSHLSKIERGLVSISTADAVALARAFGVTVADIVPPSGARVPLEAADAVALAQAFGVTVESMLDSADIVTH